MIALMGIFYLYADASGWRKRIFGIAHGFSHFFAICILQALCNKFNWMLGLDAYPVIGFYLFMIEMILLGGVVGASIWGIYLFFVSHKYALHKNDAFSAMAIEGFKNFLRIKIKGNELTIYPIGLESVPRRDGWEKNPKYEIGNQNESEIRPKADLTPHLIEGPIVIK